MGMSSEMVPKIVEFVTHNGKLEALDISWNNFRPPDFLVLMNYLSKNVCLRSLNVSWNLIIEGREQIEKTNFRYPTGRDKWF